MVVVCLVGMAMLFIMFTIHKSGFGGGSVVSALVSVPVHQPAEKTPKWQVWFAGEWHECQLIGDNSNVGKLVRVHLKGRPCHLTTRRPDEIRQVQ